MKIKIWHKKDKVMLYPPTSVSSSNNITLKNGEDWIYKGETVQAFLTWNGLFYINGEFQDVEILEFTGLKDDLGRDIFEGDILEWKGELIAEVFFEQENAAFVIKSKKGGGAFMSENYALNFQIIGNIFEHPELLK